MDLVEVIQELVFVIFFEVDRYHIAHAALHALHEMQVIDSETLRSASSTWNIDADKLNPVNM
jgi:pyruvate dehydrogenase complex dehydrogenase (E1) component